MLNFKVILKLIALIKCYEIRSQFRLSTQKISNGRWENTIFTLYKLATWKVHGSKEQIPGVSLLTSKICDFSFVIFIHSASARTRLIWINLLAIYNDFTFFTRKPPHTGIFFPFLLKDASFKRFLVEFPPISKCRDLHVLSTNYKYYCVSEFDCFS